MNAIEYAAHNAFCAAGHILNQPGASKEVYDRAMLISVAAQEIMENQFTGIATDTLAKMKGGL